MIKRIIKQFTISKLVQEIIDDINRNPKSWYPRPKILILPYMVYSNSFYTIISAGVYQVISKDLTKWYKTTFLERYLLKKALKHNGIK